MNLSFYEDTDAHMQAGLSELIGDEILKTAMEQCGNLTPDASPVLFSDPIEREHPVFSSETAVASYVYVKMAGYNLRPGVIERLANTARGFGHEELVDKVEAALHQPEGDDVMKTAGANDAHWAIVDGEKAAYPLVDYDSVVASATKIAHDYMSARLPAPLMKTAASAVVSAAERYNVESFMLPEIVSKHAQSRLPDFEKLAAHLHLRVFGLDPSVAESAAADYKRAADYSDDTSDPDTVAQMRALHIQTVDKRYGIKVGETKLDPLSLVYTDATTSDVEKIANAHVCLFDTMIPNDTFTTVCDRVPLPAFFDEAAITKIAAAKEAARKGHGVDASVAVDTLDMSDKQELARLIMKAA